MPHSWCLSMTIGGLYSGNVCQHLVSTFHVLIHPHAGDSSGGDICVGPALEVVVFRSNALCISSALKGMWSCAVSLRRRPILMWPSVCAESRADPKGFGERWPLLSGDMPPLLSEVMAPLLEGEGGRVANLLGPPTRSYVSMASTLRHVFPC